MTALAVVCLAALVINVVRDLFFPASREVEVWLGIEVRGALAMLTAPLHWAIFATGAWAAWTQRPWVARAVAAYLFYAAVSHLVWSESSPNGRGWLIGLAQAVAISTVAMLILRADRARQG
jgi:hypothetical protein